MQLSIIVPIYNVDEYLPRCLDSILAQTFSDFELILVDDGSPDRCGEIIDEYAKKENRIVVIHQNNKGVSAARNAGLRVARGKYIGFVDPDDWIEPIMYESLIKPLENNKQLSISACGFRFHDSINGNTRNVNATTLRKNIFSSVELMRIITTSHCYDLDIFLQSLLNKVFRKNVIERVVFYGNFGEDCDAITEMFKNNYWVLLEERTLYHYFIHGLSLTQKKKIESQVRILEIYKKRIEQYDDDTIIEASEFSFCKGYIYYYCEFKKRNLKWTYHRESLKRYFNDLKQKKKCDIKTRLQLETFLLIPDVFYVFYQFHHRHIR